jgi:hypothetical protein
MDWTVSTRSTVYGRRTLKIEEQIKRLCGGVADHMFHWHQHGYGRRIGRGSNSRECSNPLGSKVSSGISVILFVSERRAESLQALYSVAKKSWFAINWSSSSLWSAT